MLSAVKGFAAVKAFTTIIILMLRINSISKKQDLYNLTKMCVQMCKCAMIWLKTGKCIDY